jgi:hypothetical protein
LQLAYGGVVIGASFYDPQTGLTVFRIPAPAPKLRAGKLRILLVASDFQETKNVNTSADNPLPNTAVEPVRLTVIDGTAMTWLTPGPAACASRNEQLAIAVSSTRTVRSVTFLDGKLRIAVDAKPRGGLAVAIWHTAKAKRGRHMLRAQALDGSGRTSAVTRTVRVCRR